MLFRLLKYLAAAILLFNITVFLWIGLYAFIPIPVTKLMVKEGEEKKVRYQWHSLDDISDMLALAVMCSEDQYFILHRGFDFQAIREAEDHNRQGRRIRGASTITQQVAKNVFLWPDRSWARKAGEAYFAPLIDALWSKQRIMEVYLNVAEFGNGIFGAEAASQVYFKKSADALTIDEAARLAAVLPGPKRYSVVKPGTYTQSRVSWVKAQMQNWGNQMTYDREVVSKMIGE